MELKDGVVRRLLVTLWKWAGWQEVVQAVLDQTLLMGKVRGSWICERWRRSSSLQVSKWARVWGFKMSRGIS